jgi:hypothetical protein
VFVSLTQRFAACRTCSRALRHEPISDDDTACDLCDVAPADGTFREIVLTGEFQLGPAIVFANVCDTCWALCQPATQERAA